MDCGVWIPNCRRPATPEIQSFGETIFDPLVPLTVVAGATARVAECGGEHPVPEFLAADGRELEARTALFAERVRPRLA